MASALLIQVSVVTEVFLDLSLPVSDEVNPHSHILYSHAFVYVGRWSYSNDILQAYRKKNLKKGANTCDLTRSDRSTPALASEDENATPGSKYQQKKAKKQAKKQAKVTWMEAFFFLLLLCKINDPFSFGPLLPFIDSSTKRDNRSLRTESLWTVSPHQTTQRAVKLLQRRLMRKIKKMKDPEKPHWVKKTKPVCLKQTWTAQTPTRA